MTLGPGRSWDIAKLQKVRKYIILSFSCLHLNSNKVSHDCVGGALPTSLWKMLVGWLVELVRSSWAHYSKELWNSHSSPRTVVSLAMEVQTKHEVLIAIISSNEQMSRPKKSVVVEEKGKGMLNNRSWENLKDLVYFPFFPNLQFTSLHSENKLLPFLEERN